MPLAQMYEPSALRLEYFAEWNRIEGKMSISPVNLHNVYIDSRHWLLYIAPMRSSRWLQISDSISVMFIVASGVNLLQSINKMDNDPNTEQCSVNTDSFGQIIRYLVVYQRDSIWLVLDYYYYFCYQRNLYLSQRFVLAFRHIFYWVPVWPFSLQQMMKSSSLFVVRQSNFLSQHKFISTKSFYFIYEFNICILCFLRLIADIYSFNFVDWIDRHARNR